MCHITFQKMQASITKPTKPMNELWSLLILSQVGHFSNKNSCRLEGDGKANKFFWGKGILEIRKGGDVKVGHAHSEVLCVRKKGQKQLSSEKREEIGKF